LGILLLEAGRLEDAARLYEKGLARASRDYRMRCNYAYALSGTGRHDEAIEQYVIALRIKPDDSHALYNLGWELVRKRNYEKALEAWQKGLARAPNEARFPNRIGRLLASVPDEGIRDGEAALKLARRAVAMTGRKNGQMLDTLAMALAEVGRFEEAAATAQEALVMAEAEKNAKLAEVIRSRLALYEKNRPYREAVPRADGL
jgi:tetratricopeptide (TPR) repeat protein